MRLGGYSCMHVWPTVWILLQSFYSSYPYSYGWYISIDSKNFILFQWYFLRSVQSLWYCWPSYVTKQTGILPTVALGALHMNGFPPICLIGVNLLILIRPYRFRFKTNSMWSATGICTGAFVIFDKIYVLNGLKKCPNVLDFYPFAVDTNIFYKIKINIPSSWNSWRTR